MPVRTIYDSCGDGAGLGGRKSRILRQSQVREMLARVPFLFGLRPLLMKIGDVGSVDRGFGGHVVFAETFLKLPGVLHHTVMAMKPDCLLWFATPLRENATQTDGQDRNRNKNPETQKTSPFNPSGLNFEEVTPCSGNMQVQRKLTKTKKARFHAPLGWGTWIRTRDAGTKTRCLTAWLYPNIIGMIARDRAVVNLLPEIDADTF